MVLNLEGMNVDAAQRVIDFASGACYTMGGNLQKISKKIFIVTPSSGDLPGDFTNLLGDTIDLSSLNLKSAIMTREEQILLAASQGFG